MPWFPRVPSQVFVMSAGQSICRHDIGEQPFVGRRKESGPGELGSALPAPKVIVVPEAGTLAKLTVTVPDRPSKQVLSQVTDCEGNVADAETGTVAEGPEPLEPVAPVIVAPPLTEAVTAVIPWGQFPPPIWVNVKE